MPPVCFPLLRKLALAGMTAAAVAPAAADVPGKKTLQRAELKLGMHSLVPAYTPGAKFRTPEAIEPVLAEELSRHWQAKLKTLRADAGNPAALLQSGKADIVLAALPARRSLPAGVLTVPTGYLASPMAIMRTDTTIKSWDQLRGRKVCLAEGGRHVGMLAARYGALEKVFKAPADALLDLRIGGCDAAVHDSALLEELIKLPEWKKFSARLPAQAPVALEFILPATGHSTSASLQKISREWQSSGFLQQQLTLMARNIAFEVYLDQHVPDCH